MPRREDLNARAIHGPGILSRSAVALRNGTQWLLRCWHRQMSRPFTIDGETYRVCLRCGARRQFRIDSWKTVGTYYRDSARNDYAAAPSRNPQLASGVARMTSGREDQEVPSLSLMASTAWHGFCNTFVGLFGNRRGPIRQLFVKSIPPRH